MIFLLKNSYQFHERWKELISVYPKKYYSLYNMLFFPFLWPSIYFKYKDTSNMFFNYFSKLHSWTYIVKYKTSLIFNFKIIINGMKLVWSVIYSYKVKLRKPRRFIRYSKYKIRITRFNIWNSISNLHVTNQIIDLKPVTSNCSK